MEALSDILIRDMKLEDLDAVCKIEQQSFSDPWTKEGFISSINAPNNIYLVAEWHQEIVGYCGLWGIVGEGQINNVAVKSNFQSKGIGEKLLTELIKNGQGKGLTSFTLEVRVSNKSARRLYQKLGFCSVGIRKNFYNHPREDAVIMWL